MHGTSRTPVLDDYIRKANTKAALQSIADAVNDLALERRCTSCAINDVAHQVTDYIRALRSGQDKNQWTKEEKKAFKSEIKGLAKSVKKDVKGAWRPRQD